MYCVCGETFYEVRSIPLAAALIFSWVRVVFLWWPRPQGAVFSTQRAPGLEEELLQQLLKAVRLNAGRLQAGARWPLLGSLRAGGGDEPGPAARRRPSAPPEGQAAARPGSWGQPAAANQQHSNHTPTSGIMWNLSFAHTYTKSKD